MQTRDLTLADLDAPEFLVGIPAQSLSGAEIIALWEREGVFDAFAYLNDLIGPGKQFTDSTEYVNHLRATAGTRTEE